MATKICCDICGKEHTFFSNFTQVYTKNDNPEFEDIRMDICSSCKRRLNKYIKSIKKEKKND